MRIYFSKLERAKKSAKALASAIVGIRLSKAQRLIAILAGYRDWHDLVANLNFENRTGFTRNDAIELSSPQIISLAHILSAELNLSWGDALYALSQSHLPGIKLTDARACENLWLIRFEQMQKISGDKHSPGSVVKLKTPGRMGEPAILKMFGAPSYLVTHASGNTCVADFEVTTPRRPLPLFMPARLKLAYGFWTEASGANVLFSRDYKPLWRLTKSRKPERLQPWLWIDKTDTEWFWDDSNSPWYSTHRLQEEERRLHNFGIRALPKLADTLPDIVFNESARDINQAVDLMARHEDDKVVQTLQGWVRFSSNLIH